MDLRSLLAQQAARFAAIDPLLPPPADLPPGETVTATAPSGTPVGGVVAHHSHPEGSLPSLWSAREVWELHPVVGATGAGGLAALLDAWRQRVHRLRAPADSACMVVWPSRDAAATRVLLDHGLLPMTVLAVRAAHHQHDSTTPHHDHEPESTTTVRRATAADLAIATELAMVEMHYATLVGAAVARPGAELLKRRALAYRLTCRDPVWLAERDGVPVGLAECWSADPSGHPTLPPGRWGFVNCLSVSPQARGSGVGRTLMAVAHQEFRRTGLRGSYLYYNLPNPLSSVFWPRQGYRPLWTLWEVRPAVRLR